MGDTVKLRGDWHLENLASGRVVAPGEVFDRSALNLDPISDDNPANDRRLIDEGLVIDAHVSPVELQGDELHERAKALGVPRSGKSAAKLREDVAAAEAQRPADAQQAEPPHTIRGDA